MCIKCQTAKDQVWAEVQDLVNYSGPLTDELQTQLDAALDSEDLCESVEASMRPHNVSVEDYIRSAQESMRCEMIAQRLAFVVTFGNTNQHGDPPSIICQRWALDLNNREAVSALRMMLFGHDGERNVNPMLDVFQAVLGRVPTEAESGD